MLEKLNQRYATEQDEIAKKRKANLFTSAQQDIKEQDNCWKNFIIDRYLLTKKNEHAKVVFEYFSAKGKTKHLKIRDMYQNDEIDRNQYLNKHRDNIIDIENKLIKVGIINKTVEDKDKYWYSSFEAEKKIKPNKGKISKVEFGRLCLAQNKYTIEYFNELKEKNELSF